MSAAWVRESLARVAAPRYLSTLFRIVRKAHSHVDW